MVDASLGMKRTCPSCAARFYDLNKDPIVCPKCGESFVVEPILPSKHDQAEKAKPEEIKPEVVEETVNDIDIVDDEAVVAEDVDEAAAVEDVDLGDAANIDVPADDDTFLETDDDAPVEDILPGAIEKDDET